MFVSQSMRFHFLFAPEPQQLKIMEAIKMFDEILQDISSINSPREHKRLKFVNRNMMELELVEQKLNDYFQINLTPEQLNEFMRSIKDVVGESRICEYLVQLIKHGEERVERHVELFQEICNVIRKVREIDSNDHLREDVVEKCSLMIYDSFHFLCDVKRIMSEVAAVYQVPYYYEVEQGNIRLRSSMLSTYKNLNTVIDDLQTLNEALWFVRHYDSLSNT